LEVSGSVVTWAHADAAKDIPRRDAVAAYFHERNGDLEIAARL
jgi:hypothetical protein